MCTSIHLALTRLLENRVLEGDEAYIDELVLQVDNTTSENKNSVVLGYLASLVGRRIVGRAEVHFMIVGHTHLGLDQTFSR